MKEAQIIEEWC